VEQDILNRTDMNTGAHTDLISSDKVDGTAVYNRNGDKLGSIAHLMIGKRDGRVSYAVMSFGGFLGMGAEEYTLPWDKLEYDVNRGGYVVDVSKEQLEKAPRYERNRDDYDRSYYEGVSGYYGSSAPTWY
jgi:PRC-barrel domain